MHALQRHDVTDACGAGAQPGNGCGSRGNVYDGRKDGGQPLLKV